VADEVTKKDLQAVQKELSKQIADLKKRDEETQTQIDDHRHEFIKGLEEENAIAVNIKKEFDARSVEIQNSINTLAKAISDLAGRIGKLESGR
jgi:hypothetical protein